MQHNFRNLREEAVTEKMQQLFKSIFDESPIGIVLFDDKFRLMVANQACCNIFGVVDTDEIAGFNLLDDPNVSDAIKDNLRNGNMARFETAFDFDRVKERGQYQTTRSGVIELDVMIVPLGELHNIHGYLVHIQDITDRKRTEKALRESEPTKKAILDGITTGLAFLNEKQEILWVNKAAATSLNKSSKEIIGDRCHTLWGNSDTPCEGCPTLKAFRSKKSEHSIMYTPDGKVWEEKSDPAYDEKGNLIGVLKIADDITETKRLQDNLIQSERLAAVGKLASSIAHEINSPLQGITALLDLIQKTRPQDETLLTNIGLLKGAADSIRDTVRKLFDLNPSGKERIQPVNVNRIIDDTIALLRTYLKKNRVHVHLDQSAEIPFIKASPQQLGYVFMNLLQNSVEAINGVLHNNGCPCHSIAGGKLDITTRFGENAIVITLSDTGPGIPDETLQVIFDPFYTRKKTMGMGIGLSICHAIIEKHKGTILAKNSPEGGAVFTITLPLNSQLT